VVIENLIKEEAIKLEYTIYYKQSQSSFDKKKEKEGLSKVITFLKENSSSSIYIKGYASEEGSDYLNFKLSGNRAKNVYAYLLSQGVSRSQMISIVQGEVTEHHGSDVKNTDAKNRRVTIILKEGEIERQVDQINSLKGESPFHIIAGSFSTMKNATDFGSKLRNKGYKIQLIKGEKRILISLASFKTRTEAKAELSRFKKVTSDIWVYEKK
jgi:hypothetical protein